ncbi:hypothetical protein OG689_44180 [Kitasatospora sp. NBC_00240]|uniref:hypothetical protein n=1 Tax=Kitasatospora sp. NBC_00240 TaxID=2903567 RepID=UPI0022528ED8|nr:hypothetical protein [Kitasatospora sp. NBC_00240]MCX5216136.1 hypothetical protein [Kitasatospora sp. NBC_00240]
MTPSPDLAVLRAAAQRVIERHADRPLPGTWRLARLDALPAIAPSCDQDHRGRAQIHADVDGLYDCCPQPWIRVGVLQVADLLLALLNQPAPAPDPTAAAPEAFSDDPTGAWT